MSKKRLVFYCSRNNKLLIFTGIYELTLDGQFLSLYNCGKREETVILLNPKTLVKIGYLD